MLFQPAYENGYHIIRVMQDSFNDADIDVLTRQIDEYLDAGKVRICLSFTPDSYPYSKLLTFLTQCHRTIRARGGTLVVVHPNQDFIDVVAQTRLDTVFEIFSSEDEIQ